MLFTLHCFINVLRPLFEIDLELVCAESVNIGVGLSSPGQGFPYQLNRVSKVLIALRIVCAGSVNIGVGLSSPGQGFLF